MSVTKYINVVSGKGGTGKTLLCTILAELLGSQNINVLVVDMDIFVRGLTALLYFHRGESLTLTDENEFTISDIFYRDESNSMKEGKLAIQRYRSFDICPAVSRINQLFNHEKELIFDTKHNQISFMRVMEFIPHDKYDYILLDCRAGYDSLISAIHESADMTICVQEDDDISNVTASNLIRQLEKDSSRKPIFSLINKARNINNLFDLENRQNQGLTSIGYIPFDMDVMNSFGEKSFWDDISKSLYKSALAEAWNKLCSKANLKHVLKYRRNSPLLSDKVEAFLGVIGLRQRVTSLLGLFITLIGATYSFLGRDIFYYIRERPDMLISLVSIFIGLTLFLFGFLSNNAVRKTSR